MSNPTANHTSQTTYTVTVTDGNSCTATDDIVVSVDDGPSWANFQHASDNTICQGTTITTYGRVYRSGTTPGNHGEITVHAGYNTDNSAHPSTWSNWVVASDNGTDGNNNEYKSDLTSSHLTSAGTYYLVYRYTYGACTVYGGNNNNIWANSGDYESVTVNALPTVGITVSETSGNSNNDGTVCAGASVTLSGTSASSYSWDNSITDGVSFTANSTTTYTVTGTDGNGCTDTETQTITVNALPTVGIAVSETV